MSRLKPKSGFAYTLKSVPKDDVEETIMSGNTDPAVDGIIVYYPIFGNRQDQYLQQIVSVGKDVEGLSHQYIFNMYQNIRFLDSAQMVKSILPCTPLAVIKILEHLHIYNPILPYGNRLFGRTICVVNRSEVVGRPLAALLANDGACVYSVDVTGVQQFTRGQGIRKRKHEVVEMEGWTIDDCAPLCDAVVTRVPGDQYKFPCHLLKDGAVCINFSSEKVCRCRLPVVILSRPSFACPENSGIGPSLTNRPLGCGVTIELRPRSQDKGLDLRPRHRQGHHRRAPAQPLAHRPEQTGPARKRRTGTHRQRRSCRCCCFFCSLITYNCSCTFGSRRGVPRSNHSETDLTR